MDTRAYDAHRYHQASLAAEQLADQERAERDKLVRELRDSDPKTWSYRRLADTVGCSPELIAHIVKSA